MISIVTTNPPRVLVPLANGFEEIEAITVIDILRRAGVEVVTAGVGAEVVEASRKTRHVPDTTMEKAGDQGFDAIILPGGQVGANHLKKDSMVRDCLLRHARDGKWVAAICAAPTVLQDIGLLAGRRATSHPSVRGELTGAQYVEERVVVDGRIVTSRAAGTAMEFAFKLVELLRGSQSVAEVNQGVMAKL